MGNLRAVVVAAVCLAGTVVGKLGPPGGPMKMPLEPVDSYKAMEHFLYPVAISDSDNDTIFECLSAKRIAIDPEKKTATFAFFFPSVGMKLSFSIKPGNEPGTLVFTSGADPTPKDGIIYYTDYENCVVANLELHGEGNQCTLWTQRELKDNVPQNCIDHFADVCGVVVPAHSRDLCPDGEGDY